MITQDDKKLLASYDKINKQVIKSLSELSNFYKDTKNKEIIEFIKERCDDEDLDAACADVEFNRDMKSYIDDLYENLLKTVKSI